MSFKKLIQSNLGDERKFKYNILANIFNIKEDKILYDSTVLRLMIDELFDIWRDMGVLDKYMDVLDNYVSEEDLTKLKPLLKQIKNAEVKVKVVEDELIDDGGLISEIRRLQSMK